MIQNAIRLRNQTGISENKATLVLKEIADFDAAFSAIDLAQYYEIDPVVAARVIKEACKREQK